MYNNNSNGSRAARAPGFMALFAIMPALGLALAACPAAAAAFAYVTNRGSDTVSVIDTATNTVVGPRSQWVVSRLRSPSARMGNTPMS